MPCNRRRWRRLLPNSNRLPPPARVQTRYHNTALKINSLNSISSILIILEGYLNIQLCENLTSFYKMLSHLELNLIEIKKKLDSLLYWICAISGLNILRDTPSKDRIIGKTEFGQFIPGRDVYLFK